MSKKETLKQRYDALSKQIDTMQTEAAERRFEVNFEDLGQIKTLMEHLNKGYKWKTQNAAVIVSLYDQLKKQTKELTNNKTDVQTAVIMLRGHELTALYQALLTVEGQGVEAARRFITMLTNIGQAVGEAMQELTQANTEISDSHATLTELEQMMTVYGADVTEEDIRNGLEVEPELETEETEETA